MTLAEKFWLGLMLTALNPWLEPSMEKMLISHITLTIGFIGFMFSGKGDK